MRNKQKQFPNREALRHARHKRIDPIPSAEFFQDCVGYVVNMPNKRRELLNKLMTYKNYYIRTGLKFKHLYVSQSTIAKEIGISREHTNSLLHDLCQKGLIGMKYRGVKKTCIYYLNSIFLNPLFREQVGHLMPSLLEISNKDLSKLLPRLSYNGNGKSLPHGFFIGATVAHFQNEFTQANITTNFLYLKNSLSKLSSSLCGRASEQPNQEVAFVAKEREGVKDIELISPAEHVKLANSVISGPATSFDLAVAPASFSKKEGEREYEDMEALLLFFSDPDALLRMDRGRYEAAEKFLCTPIAPVREPYKGRKASDRYDSRYTTLGEQRAGRSNFNPPPPPVSLKEAVRRNEALKNKALQWNAE